MSAAVVIPVKAFHAAKARLAPALDPSARATLARLMATRVVEAAHPLPVTVVCDDDVVAQWAESLGVTVGWTPGLGLDGAVAAGVRAVEMAGATEILVAHADLPLARDLTTLTAATETTASETAARETNGGPTSGPDHEERSTRTITLVPDRHGDGTNVIVLPAGIGFRFAYGPGSFARHRAEATRLGHTVRVVRDPLLGWDVDHPADLAHPEGHLAALSHLGVFTSPGQEP